MPRAACLLRLPPDDVSLIEDTANDVVFAIEPIGDEQVYASLTSQFSQEKFVLSVSTETASRCALSQAVAAALARRVTMAASALCDLEIATQEAISNAVLHGNLALPTMEGSDPAVLEARILAIQRRLADPALARRRVTIACDWNAEEVSIDVYDEGAGFNATPPSKVDEQDGAPSLQRPSGGGSGLHMIRRLTRSMEIDAERRRVRMIFRLGDRTSPGGDEP